jgi:hypothetical protein
MIRWKTPEERAADATKRLESAIEHSSDLDKRRRDVLDAMVDSYRVPNPKTKGGK